MKNNSFFSKAIALVAVSVVTAATASADTYWLDAGATGTGDGSSKENAFTTWNEAFAAAGSANGNVLNVLPGTYTLTVAPAQWGSGRQNVTIRGVNADGDPLESAGAVEINGGGSYQIARCNTAINLVISGIRFAHGLGGTSAGAAIDVRKSGTAPYSTNQGFAVSNCVFDSCTGGPAVYCLAAGASRFVGCEFRNNANTSAATCISAFNASADYPLHVENCTFTGNDGRGQTSEGAGTCFGSAYPARFSGCAFEGNFNSSRGVAMSLDGSVSNRFENCTFRLNRNEQASPTYANGVGGVLYCRSTSNTTNVFVSCTFDGNWASSHGGVAAIRGTTLFVAEGCAFTGNESGQGAAVISVGPISGVADSSPVAVSLSDCEISGNVATNATLSASEGWIVDLRGNGSKGNTGNSGSLEMARCAVTGNLYTKGGVNVGKAGSLVDRCEFKFNATPPLAEGASPGAESIFCVNASAGTVQNCLLACNTNRLASGAALNVANAGTSVLNCTVVGNRAAGKSASNAECAGIVADGNAAVRNCIFADNAYSSGEIQLINYASFEYCFADANLKSPSLWNGNTGNLRSADGPGFADAANGDYTLASTSPCRNAGDNTLWAGVVDATDLAGNARLVGTVDLGCYEWFDTTQPTVLSFR